MAKNNLLQYICDACGEKETFNVSRPFSEGDKCKIQLWITVLRENGTQEGDATHFCRTGCEITGARQRSDITLVEDKPSGPLVTA